MQRTRKYLSLLLSLVIVLGLLPAAAHAVESDYVYISISFDGKYINDKNGSPIVYVPVSMADIASVDLGKYGLGNMRYDANGDGAYETTALQLIIYAHEKIYGGQWSDVEFDALPGSSYFQDGIFGFTENLVYFLNGDFPVDESQTGSGITVGATSDRIVLKAGDFLDIASFSCYSFLYDEAGGFHFFADSKENFLHEFTTEANKQLSFKLMHSFCDLMSGTAWLKSANSYKIHYGKTFGTAEGTATTDGNGNCAIVFDQPGTYYLWCDGGSGTDKETHAACGYYEQTGKCCIVSSPAYAEVTVTEAKSTEQPQKSQDVSAVLNATMAQLAATVTEPAFGTNAGEWTVFSLARGNYFTKDNAYFTAYYDRIVETVNTTAANVNMNGALHKSKSTDNARLIVALSAIGKDATSVGEWDLVEPYSANGLNWIRKQGLNGTIWALIALDSNNYKTSDPTIRQQCVDSLLSLRHNDGGWSLVTSKTQPSNVDITGMALTALYPYREQPEVKAACEEAIAWLSQAQLATGGFPYGTGETSESCAWAIVALTMWGINPDTDPRFIKNGKSAVDNLLTYYIAAEKMFAHQGTASNAMATDQACYALVAYHRFINGETALFDYSDVWTVEATEELTAALSLPAQINQGDTFNGVISINRWDNSANYKLIDFIMMVPQGLTVTDVTAGESLNGGEISYHLEEDTGKLRVVYFDANKNSTLTITGKDFPAELFTVGFHAQQVTTGTGLEVSLSGMSVKRTSHSESEDSMVIVNTEKAKSTVNVVEGLSFSAKCLYTGDDVDLIPSTKKAVAVMVTGIVDGAQLTYYDGTHTIAFQHSSEISAKTGIATYVALVSASIDMENFVNENYFTISGGKAAELVFGDTNGDGVINAQDALNVVDTWLRKGDAPTDDDILTMNVNGDSRINTFDALGIVEAFVNKTDYVVVTKASTMTANP